MGSERKPSETLVPGLQAPQNNVEEHLRRANGLDARIHGDEEQVEETTTDVPEKVENESQWETDGGSMARQVPDLITDVMQGG